MVPSPDLSDSSSFSGGSIPGAPGQPAFTMTVREPSALPILIAVPHAGRAYPGAVLEDLRACAESSVRLEDRFVDLVGRGLARATGADLLVAHAPRAMIDLNRAPEDVDWGMVVREGRPLEAAARQGLSPRARSGLGLIPRRLPGVGELWRRRYEAHEVEARIEGIHAPYHAALAHRLEVLRARWGAALLIDLHSMPPLGARVGREPVQIVVGDRFGASCHGSVVGATFVQLARMGREASHNRPYAGGYGLDRHARPRDGVHAMQIEIDRTCYLDSHLREPGEGLEPLVEDLAGLVRSLAGVVAELADARRGGDWPLAAQ
ncbi:N-formylglutamate amidohydrolase [Novosphingobium sp. 1949]|uniref:N-formylglutamate amidohydrolase n=1 Tax=Novosphingobium organovorum TaxID=2930092 RepID=A0ABT0BC25_9SPHN|nr:N-formylglutamate amidohydrolase [Novosphingobium organovorum]MCJ2182605.1 N-formylglutamate amidohydrolase [Novosphingobium organovorum]